MATPSNPSIAMPTMEQPIVDLIAADGRVSLQWWSFFQRLFSRSAATIPYTVAVGQVAAGVAQADALALQTEWSEIATVAAGTGVLLFNFGTGFDSRVWNDDGVNSLNVYPPIGLAIDGLAANAPYVLAAGKSQVFSQLSATLMRSLQLG